MPAECETSRCAVVALSALVMSSATAPGAALADDRPNHYTDTVLVANSPEHSPLIMIDPLLGNGWGLAIRPPGAGGHFWVSNFNTGTTTTYVGDVHAADGSFTPLFQDELVHVRIPVGNGKRVDGAPIVQVSQPTGQVFNHSASDFVVSGEGITAASKFIFVTAEGTISGWTEVKDAQTGIARRQTASVITFDRSQEYNDERLIYTGCAVTDFASNNRLYVTNFIDNRVEVFDHEWQPVELAPGAFTYPDQPGNFSMWNIQLFHTGPNGEPRLWGVYAMVEEPWEEDPSFGAVVEFDLEGNYIRRLETAMDYDRYADSELRAPWGIAIAPDDFGPLSGCMIVANFGDGTLPAFSLETGKFVDWVRDGSGEPMSVDGVWGILFGNGVALGDQNALYYAAGPRSEFDGTFGSVRYTPSVRPRIQSQPRSVEVGSDGVVVLEVVAPSPVRCEFQWQVERGGEWVDLEDGTVAGSSAQVRGSGTAVMMMTRVDSGGRYRCVVSNACGSVVSEVTEVVVAGGE